MAGLKIDSGKLEPTSRFRDVPRQKWEELLRLRREAIDTEFTNDCNDIVEFMADVDVAYQHLGYESPEAMIYDGYGLNPEDVRAVVAYLKRARPHVVGGFADTLASAVADAKANPSRLKENRRPTKGEPSKCDNITLTRGTDPSYLLARMARDADEETTTDPDNRRVYEQALNGLESGEHTSVRQAAIACGIVKVQSRADKCASQFRNGDENEQLDILQTLIELATPDQQSIIYAFLEDQRNE